MKHVRKVIANSCDEKKGSFKFYRERDDTVF